jgi:hypothetical protein
MALFVPDRAPQPDPAQRALHFIPPTARERRAQAIHRLQVGLFGLAGMLLLVGLANIIMDRARLGEDAAAALSPAAADPSGGAVAAGANAASDPLADIGVVPDLPAASASPSPSRAPSPRQQGR